MVRHAPHILGADFLSSPEAGADGRVVDVEVVVVDEVGVGRCQRTAGQQLRHVLQHHHALLGLHILFLLHNLLCFLSKEFRS